MRIFFTNDAFVKHGTAMPGIPFLADASAQLVESANRYLYHVAAIRGRTRSRNTWRTYGDHLYEFFAFLEANSLLWNVVGESHIAAWRNQMLSRHLKRDTINQRIRAVSAFYTWCKRTKLVADIPFGTESVLVRKIPGFLAHVDGSGNRATANELTLPTVRALPKFLSLPQAIRFVTSLAPARTQLVAMLMLLCGLRREEAAGLDIRVLPSPAGCDPGKSIRMTLDPALTPTKGNKERWVNLPYALAGQLFDYQMRERPKLAHAYKRKHGAQTTKLFLTRFGNPLSLDGLDDQFLRTSKKTGIKCSPHTLRHTFAVHELVRMSGKPRINALTWVRDRLGHASITTTEVYLKAADLMVHEEVDGFVSELLEAMAQKITT